MKKLIAKAHLFNILVSYAFNRYDSNFRNIVLNVPPFPNSLPFNEIAHTVMENLQEIDPESRDNQIMSVIHKLMDIVNSAEVPEAMALYNASNNALTQIKNKAGDDKDKMRNAQYLLNLTKIIIIKHYQQQQAGVQSNQGTQSQSTELQQQVPMQQENLAKFLQRVYKTLRGGQQLNQDDLNYWRQNKNILMSRLNVLTRSQNKTPLQEQERAVIQFVNYHQHKADGF